MIGFERHFAVAGDISQGPGPHNKGFTNFRSTICGTDIFVVFIVLYLKEIQMCDKFCTIDILPCQADVR